MKRFKKTENHAVPNIAAVTNKLLSVLVDAKLSIADSKAILSIAQNSIDNLSVINIDSKTLEYYEEKGGSENG